MRARRGVTLLEALVALAIIATSFGAILEMQAQLVKSLSAVQRAHERAQWRLNLVEVASSLDHDTVEQGQLDWPDGGRIEWRKASDRATRPFRLGSRMRGASTVTLADVSLKAEKSGREIASETISVTVATPPPVDVSEDGADSSPFPGASLGPR
jgi:type II secretory pathway component PulK